MHKSTHFFNLENFSFISASSGANEMMRLAKVY